MKKDFDGIVDDYIFVFSILMAELSKLDDFRSKIVFNSIENSIKQIQNERQFPEKRKQILAGIRQTIRDTPNVVRLPADSLDLFSKLFEERFGVQLDSGR